MAREYKSVEEKLEKNSRIKETMKATFEKRKQQKCFVFQCKIDESQLSKKQKEELKMSFIEAKWLKNDILRWSEQNENNKPWLYKFNGKITHRILDRNTGDFVEEEKELKFLGGSVRQQVQKQICSNIRTLSTLKKKGNKVGRIKFCREYRDLDFNHYGTTYRIINSRRMRFQGISKTVVVNGLRQFYEKGYEYANCKLINTPKGYYVRITCFLDKNKTIEKEKINKTLGIDFGCAESFVTSEGEKINVKIQETERLKKLQRKFARQKKGSKSRNKTKAQIKREYQKISNRKNDAANKIVAKFNQYETIVIQDEQLSNWKKMGHGKAVQHSILGRVKFKLMQNPNVVVLDKFFPTTKLCSKCGMYHDDLKLSDRTFKCACGVEEDRDIHAAKNMVWFYENNLGVERTKFTRPEMEKAVLDVLDHSSESCSKNEILSMKDEGPCSLGKD